MRQAFKAQKADDMKEKDKLKQTRKSLKQAEEFAEAVLNSLSAHIAILDEKGIILKTNRAWKEFAMSNHIQVRPDMIGVNYLNLCECAEGDDSENARNVARGIRKVIEGEEAEFVLDYPCHSPSEKRWFYMRVTPMTGPGPLRIVVSHENITALKLTEEALKKREAELHLKTLNLDEANTALKVLLKRREDDRVELEEKVLLNTRELLVPYLEKLKESGPDSRQSEYLNILEAHLNDITSPFLHRMYAKYQHLTPREIQIASLIKEGLTSKDIANVLNISTDAVDFHRKNIRKKFDLTRSKVNLRSYLLSLEA